MGPIFAVSLVACQHSLNKRPSPYSNHLALICLPIRVQSIPLQGALTLLTNFRCTVVTPEAQILDEQVCYASIPAHDGQIGLAHLRASLLVKLGSGPLQIADTQGNRRVYFVSGGFAQMVNDHLTVLTDETIPVDDLDRQQGQADLARALKIQALSDEEVADRTALQDRARSIITLAGS